MNTYTCQICGFFAPSNKASAAVILEHLDNKHPEVTCVCGIVTRDFEDHLSAQMGSKEPHQPRS